MQSRLKRLHVAASLAEALAYAGADEARRRVEAMRSRIDRVDLDQPVKGRSAA